MLNEKLKNVTIILGSGSPRRQQFLTEMGIAFEVRLKPVEEVYPNSLRAEEISDFLSILKAESFKKELKDTEILITSDTVVWHNGESLAKAKNSEEAEAMLNTLSNGWHDVITSVCFTTTKSQIVKHAITSVNFKKISKEEISHYIQNFQPYDKAGAYGIQEWLGLIAISEIKGSYTNVVGLPTQLVYETLLDMSTSFNLDIFEKK